MAKFGELALRSDDLDEILTEASRLVGEALGTELAKVVELQGDGHTLLVRAGVGWKPGVVGVTTIQVTENTSEGRALKTGKPVISPDIRTEKRFTYPPFLTDNGVRAIANVVIIGAKDKPPFGILQVDSRKPREFNKKDIAFLQSYANLLASAVERLRSNAETRDGQVRLRLANEELETKVAERTRELTEANASLRAEAEERERVEGELRQALKMEAVGQLTGGLAHDFNNLLAGISGSLELIRIRTAQGRAAEVERYVEAGLEATNRAASLTHRLLAFSRRQTLDPRPTDVNRLIGGMKELFSRTLGPSVQIEITLAGKLGLALCDPHQLESALLNLVINARDAMPDGGHLVIETTNAVLPDRPGTSTDEHPTNLPPKDYVALSVTDTGTGMTLAVLAHAFDPFFTTKPIGLGTGLGLSMVYGFAQQSGGHVHLRSEEGQGLTATIYLPRYFGALGNAAEVDAASGPPAQGGTGAVVLVVEDESSIRMMTVEVLSDLGYTVLEAVDGRSGLSFLETTTRIDLLLTDVGLPGGMNGRQLADAARQRRPDLKVLFVTGYADKAAVGSGLVEDGMQVLTKPFRIDALAAKIRNMLGE